MDAPTTILTSASTQTSLSAIISPTKRKRRPAGTPDPDAEVIALSPKTLMESDRYVCEICNQGFQRDQNLQMHRRRHKVPWKLLKRVDPEVRKRVYVCPDPSCLHHDPDHALGDLVGIKKHYRRKHSCMKQWECDKCSKAYAVQSDYKAHLKTCGTRGHCCDCGRVFSRIESFIEHQDACTAARNKTKSASSELEAASLLTPGLRVDGQNCSDIFLHPLPVQISTSPGSPASASNMEAHACSAIPGAAPPPLLSPPPPVTLPWHRMTTSMHSQATQDDSISWEAAPQAHIPHNHLSLQRHKVELQLLPTSKAHLNQLESSQNSVTWGKEINSTKSTSSRTYSSPASKTVEDKGMRKGADCPEMLPMSGAASTAAAAPICKLQLSIGLSNTDHFTYDGKSTSLHVSRDKANQEDKSKQLNAKATSCMPWLPKNPFPLNVVNDARPDVPASIPNIRVAKRNSTVDLQLAAGSFDHRCSSVLSSQSGVDKLDELPQRQDLFSSCRKNVAAEAPAELADKNGTTPSHIMHDEDAIVELLHVTQRSSKQSLESEGTGQSKLLRCDSTRESVVAPDISDQLQSEQSDSLSGSFKEPDSVSNLLQLVETYNLSAEESVSQQLSFLLTLDKKTPTAAAEVAEVLLQEAREKLRRASAEKLEAEKAWREARKEREQAEEELAKAERIAEYNRMVERGKGTQVEEQGAEGGTRKATFSSSTLGSSPCNSIANSQAASSNSMQIRQLHAGGVLCSAPTFITCPTCHHTQILYSSPAAASSMQGTLFLASPVELTPANTLIGTPYIKVPSSPTHFS